MLRTFLLIFIVSVFSSVAFSQTSREVEPVTASAKNQTAVTKHFVVQKTTFRHRYDDYYDQLIVEYEKRMIANVKKYEKLARIAKKPQYADHSYFGHKRKPKKRAVGKRKYCRECEIVH